MNIKPRIEKFFASEFHCVVDITKTKAILSYPYLTIYKYKELWLKTLPNQMRGKLGDASEICERSVTAIAMLANAEKLRKELIIVFIGLPIYKVQK